MTSDVRDVLNLPEGGAGPRPSKKQKVAAPKPNLKGLAREVHLLGGDNPIAIVPEPTQFKKRRLASRKPAARWDMRPFRNTGREDQSLILHHWKRQETKEDGEGVAQESAETTDEMEDSTFSKYSVRVSVPQYSDDQYRQHLQSAEWSKEETDYLMGLVQDLDIRWPLVWDRYEWSPPATNGEANADGDESKAVVPAACSRSMEDLKARYYEVASKMMAAQKPVQYMSQSEFALHEMMAHFNPQQEKARKDFAMNSLSRSRDETREEESLLLEIKRILARSERFNEERRELYNRLDYPRAETDIGSFKSSSGLQTLLQNLMSADKSKKRKSIMGTDGVSPGAPTGPQPATQDSGKRDSIATASASAHRDSIGAAATPMGGSKKAQQQPPSQQQQQQQQQPNLPQQQQQERRKLNEHEEAIYGVTRFDRLGSGPTFRTEKINKLFSHKSNQQQMRINNTLNELDVPSKLAMATAATTQQYEQLLVAVNGLLEARKLSDKFDAEIKLERTKKAERERALAPPEPEKETQNGETKGETNGDDAGGGGDGGVADEAKTARDAAQKDEGEWRPTAPAEGDGDNDGSEKKAQTDGNEGAEEQVRDATDREKGAGPGIAHKRSASVLSTMSDKSAKRQKK
ncbi:SANT/Myb-like domain of DAMP1 [Hirsutella rhossiliensis]|uniref:SWR1-complex protein 4 n=1 Tax=Hirsutella rhossiliensis TaxID=111463 RepID=A0A9P8MYW6_9HYPO|nr:SANT/Myb-like domain of DAMP1 [Hirsutella rhossiliensis]KAH0963835.1 SANT/Myb-like domain of DAMP1 [Hirsutella rhossiliensis]